MRSPWQQAPDCEVRLAAALDRFAMLNFAAPLPGTLGLASWRPAAVVLRSCLHCSKGALHASLHPRRLCHALKRVAHCPSSSGLSVAEYRSLSKVYIGKVIIMRSHAYNDASHVA